MNLDITTTAGELFTNTDSIDLARLVLRRFGDVRSAHEAWKRLLQNQCSLDDFRDLVFTPTHTKNCTGECL